MAGITKSLKMYLVSGLIMSACASGCVSTEALYAEYDAADCRLIASTDDAGAINLHEQITDTHYPWEPAVYFAFDSSDLATEENARLDKSIQVLKKFPSLVVGLQGFTDRKGSLGYNEALAEARVLAVKSYIESQGITSERIILQPIGEVLPQIDSEDDVARAVNRRVELMLLDKSGRPLAIEYAMNQPE